MIRSMKGKSELSLLALGLLVACNDPTGLIAPNIETGNGTDRDAGGAGDAVPDWAEECPMWVDSLDIVADANNWIDMCSNRLGVQGPLYTFTDEAGSTITLRHDNRGEYCLTGTVAMVFDEESDDAWGSSFAFDLCKQKSSVTGVPIAECPRDLSDIIGIRATFTGSLPVCEVRLKFHHELNFGSPYLLVTSTNQPRDYLIEDARVWWDEDLPSVDPSSVSSVRINIASDMEGAHAFDFCMRDVSIITR